MNELGNMGPFSTTITRMFAWTPDRVFEAWAWPDWLTKWFHPFPNHSTVAEIDFRIGGAYRLAIRDTGGHEAVATGVYLEIERPTKLVFTWKWEHSQVERGESSVTIDLAPTAGGTQLTLVHAGLESQASADAHDEGWGGCLDRLEEVVSESRME
jgi:uncharacterized protein YndB with AHSA1/START domain